MKVQQILCAACMFMLAIPMFANAEIYKWKDKNGVTRYSDTAPPSNVKANTLRGHTVEPVAPSKVAPNSESTKQAAPTKDSVGIEEQTDANAKADQLKARNAEAKKNNKLEESRLAKLNVENCKAAKANYQTFAQGGRIYKNNEAGDREYYDDAGLKEAKANAQAEINQYCR